MPERWLFPRLRPWLQTSNAQILLVAAFLLLCANQSFITQVLRIYGGSAGNAPALLSLALVVGAVMVFLFALVCFGRATRPVLIALLLMASLAAHFMDAYGVVINSEMLRNALETNLDEAFDLITWRLLAYLVLLGILPAFVLAQLPLRWHGWRAELLARLRLMLACVGIVAVAVPAFGGFYASFVREHKSLRSYINPLYFLSAAARLAGEGLAARRDGAVSALGTDAQIPAHDVDRELIILVLGETARADRLALNGYARDTNPRLRASGVISFPDFWACGTSTAAALPCMFDVAGEGGGRRENLLDVLQHAGVNVTWFDNNSDSKGVAARVPYQYFKTPETNPLCDVECRDEGMLGAVQRYIDAHPKGDIFIVLHQMGNHGPAYYKRYPPAFEKFTPVCRSGDLNRCTQEEIGNAYDNALLYTDHFLAEVIGLLERNSKAFEAGMFYVSDHGESLGEGGVYLHGLPKAVAPPAQLHVPALMWFASSYDEIDRAVLEKKRTQRFSHDNLFHTVLGLLEVESAVYRADLDILSDCRKPEK